MEDQNHLYNNFDQSYISPHYNISPISSPQRNEEEESEKSLYLLDTPLNNYRTGIGSTNYQFINEYNSTNYGSIPIEDNLIEANEIENETESVEYFNQLYYSKVIINEQQDSITSENQKQPANEETNKINTTNANKGRPSKINPYKGEHTRKASDNGSKVVITKCKNNIHNFLLKQIRLFINCNKKNNEFTNSKTILHIPTIYQHLNKGGRSKYTLFYTSMKSLYCSSIPKRVKNKIRNERDSSKYTLFYTSMKSLYCSSIPKRVKNKIRNERDKYSYNKDTLTKILEAEKNDETILDKKLNNLFEANFIVYLDAFLNDKNIITINGINYDLGIEFETFKDCFNIGESAYTKEEKDEIKAYIYSIINKEMHFRNRKKRK